MNTVAEDRLLQRYGGDTGGTHRLRGGNNFPDAVLIPVRPKYAGGRINRRRAKATQTPGQARSAARKRQRQTENKALLVRDPALATKQKQTLFHLAQQSGKPLRHSREHELKKVSDWAASFKRPGNCCDS